MQKKTIYILLVISIILNLILGIRQYLPSKTAQNANSSSTEEGFDELTENIYFIGNSIIKHAKLDSILGNRHIVNQAVSGMTSTDAVMLSNQLVPTKPKKVFIMLGINDIKSKVPINITIRNIGHFVYTIKRYSPKTEIHLISVLPVNENIDNYDIKNSDVKELNAVIKEFCNRFNFTYIDLFNVLLDGESGLDKKFTTDGLHINEAAYVKLGTYLKSYTE